MLAAIIAIFAIIADQITKYIVVQNIELHDEIPFIKGLMSFYHTRNTGGGWSILDGGGAERVILITVSLLAMGLVVFILAKNYHRHPLMNISLAMVLGGGVGNMIDRIRLEYVVDFLHTEFIDFPTFNIADCFITVGAILLAVYVIFYDSKVEKRLAEEKAANEALVGVEANEVDVDVNEIQPESEELTQENTEEQGEDE